MATSDLQRLLIRIEGDASKLRSALAEGEAAVTRSSGRMTGALQKLDAGFSRVGRALGALGLGVSVAGFVSIVRNAIDAAGRMQDLADQLQIGVEALQAFGAAADQSGVGADAFQAALGRLNEATGEAVGGNKAMVKAFDDLDVAFRNADGSARSNEEIIADLAERYVEAADKTEFLADLTDVMGRQAGRLGPILQEVADGGLQAFIDKQRELGQVASEDTIRVLDELGDMFDRFFNRVSVGSQEALADLVKFLGVIPRTEADVLDRQIATLQERWDQANAQLERGEFGPPGFGVAMSDADKAAMLKDLEDLTRQILELVEARDKLLKGDGAISAPSGRIIDTSGIGGGGGGRPRGGSAAPNVPLPPHKPEPGADPNLVFNEAAGSLHDWIAETVAFSREAGVAADGMGALTDSIQKLGGAIGGIVEGLISGDMDWKDALGSLAGNWIEMWINNALGSLTGGMGGIGGGSFGGGSFGSMFAGLFAEGGRIGAGQFGIVGEEGPELVQGPASVTPMGRGGHTFYIDARGADREGLMRLERQIREINGSIEWRAVSAVADSRRRGGNFAAAFDR